MLNFHENSFVAIFRIKHRLHDLCAGRCNVKRKCNVYYRDEIERRKTAFMFDYVKIERIDLVCVLRAVYLNLRSTFNAIGLVVLSRR